MSGTIASVLVMLASQLLPLVGVEVGTEQLTSALSTVITIVAGLVIWYKRVQRGDIKPFGARK